MRHGHISTCLANTTFLSEKLHDTLYPTPKKGLHKQSIKIGREKTQKMPLGTTLWRECYVKPRAINVTMPNLRRH
jgi:hypothetical protein